MTGALDGADQAFSGRVESPRGWLGFRRRWHDAAVARALQRIESLQRRLDRANDEIRMLYAERQRRQTTISSSVRARGEDSSSYVDTRPLGGRRDSIEQAMVALAEEHRSKLRFVFLAAEVGYVTLLPNDPEFREQQILLCRKMDDVLSASLCERDRRDLNEAQGSYWTTMKEVVRKGSIDVGHG